MHMLYPASNATYPPTRPSLTCIGAPAWSRPLHWRWWWLIEWRVGAVLCPVPHLTTLVTLGGKVLGVGAVARHVVRRTTVEAGIGVGPSCIARRYPTWPNAHGARSTHATWPKATHARTWPKTYTIIHHASLGQVPTHLITHLAAHLAHHAVICATSPVAAVIHVCPTRPVPAIHAHTAAVHGVHAHASHPHAPTLLRSLSPCLPVKVIIPGAVRVKATATEPCLLLHHAPALKRLVKAVRLLLLPAEASLVLHPAKVIIEAVKGAVLLLLNDPVAHTHNTNTHAAD